MDAGASRSARAAHHGGQIHHANRPHHLHTLSRCGDPTLFAHGAPQHLRRVRLRLLALCVGGAVIVGLPGMEAFAQDAAPTTTTADAQEAHRDDLEDRPIAAVLVRGLNRVNEQLVRNNLRTAVGDPYDPRIVSEDVARVTRLGEFRSVDAAAQMRPDGAVEVTFIFVEEAIVNEVQVVGNTLISDQELREQILQLPGVQRNDFQIERSKLNIEELYRDKGHYLATITVDESELEETGILLFRVIEGPRVLVRAIEFEGNAAFNDEQLHGQIDTRTWIPIFRKGALDNEVLQNDLAALNRFYRERGFLNVRVDRRIELSPDDREAKVVYLISEGRAFTLGDLRVQHVLPDERITVFAPEQIQALLEIKPGDIYQADTVRKSIVAVREAYGMMGYLDAEVTPVEVRGSPDTNSVDLLLEIEEGSQYTTGLIFIRGNELTKDKVIRQQTELRPGRPFDATELQRTEQRLQRTQLFGRPIRVAVQDPDPLDPLTRDVLIEVREQNTGSFNFGVAAGTDSGVFGEFSLNQRNFDIADWPESLEEYLSGRSFRGAGQRFNMTVSPGNERFLYSVNVTEPHLFDSDYSLRVGGSYFRRIYSLYDQERISGNFGVGRQFGDIWNGAISARVERVALENIEADAPTEIFDDAGPESITGIGLTLTRSTVTTINRPGEGSQLELSLEQVGLLGGDHTFTKLGAEYTTFFTLDEDFLGRKSTLRLNTRANYILGGDPPVYEQLYLGGRTLRGLEFRTVSPKGIENNTGDPSDEPVGGEWLFFAGAQYEFPIFQDAFTGVFFVDSGTVLDEVGFDDYRISIGAGIRLYVPQFGPVPIAIDFAIPIRKADDDETQFFSFAAEIPF